MEDGTLRVLGLDVSEYVGLRVFSVRFPEEGVIEIKGENGAGKSTALSALAVALGGPKLAPDQPIRDGAEEAEIRADFGPFQVTRKFTRKADGGVKSSMEIMSADPALARTQKMLDSVFDRIAIRPGDLARMTPAQQRDAFLDLIGAREQVEKLDRERDNTYQNRTLIGREVDKLKGQLAGFPSFEGVPDAEESVADVMRELAAIAEERKAYSAADGEVAKMRQNAARASDRAKARQDEMEAIKKRFEALKAERDGYLAEATKIDEQRKAAEEALKAKEPRDDTPLQEKLGDLEQRNGAVREKAKCREVSQLLASKEEEYRDATKRIEEIDKAKLDLVKAAKLPIDGIAIDSTGVKYKGHGLSQCCSSERLRVGLAYSMAARPELRCIIAEEAICFDPKQMGVVREMTSGKGYQLIVERLAQRDAQGNPPKKGIFIEDGGVVSIDGVLVDGKE